MATQESSGAAVAHERSATKAIAARRRPAPSLRRPSATSRLRGASWRRASSRSGGWSARRLLSPRSGHAGALSRQRHRFPSRTQPATAPHSRYPCASESESRPTRRRASPIRQLRGPRRRQEAGRPRRPNCALRTESAGINRHGEGDENALHRRPSESWWPRVMRWRSARAQQCVDRGTCGLG